MPIEATLALFISFSVTVITISLIGYFSSDLHKKRKCTKYIAEQTNRKYKKLLKETKEMDFYDLEKIYFGCVKNSEKRLKESINDMNKHI